MTHGHVCKTDDAVSAFRSLRAIAVDEICPPLGRGCCYAPRQRAHCRKSAWKSIETIILGSVRERSSFNMRFTAPHQQLRSYSYENANCGMRICDALGRPQLGNAAHRQHASIADSHDNGCYVRLQPRRARMALHARRTPGHLPTSPPRRPLLGMALRGSALRLVAPQ
jgi:hypothetical protein